MVLGRKGLNVSPCPSLPPLPCFVSPSSFAACVCECVRMLVRVCGSARNFLNRLAGLPSRASIVKVKAKLASETSAPDYEPTSEEPQQQQESVGADAADIARGQHWTYEAGQEQV